MIVEDCVG